MNQTDLEGKSPLMAAACGKHFQSMISLLEVGASVNIQNDFGSTALIAAAQCGFFRSLCLLLKAGADVNHTNMFNCSALYYTSIGGYYMCLEKLVRSGANVNIASTEGLTPLMGASWNQHITCVKFLLESGADVNTVNNYGQTALVYAAGRLGTDIVITLLKSGARVENMEFLELEQSCHLDVNMWQILHAAGADVNGIEKKRSEVTLKDLCITSTRNHLLKCQSSLNLFCSVPQLGLPLLLERLLLFNVSLDGDEEEKTFPDTTTKN